MTPLQAIAATKFLSGTGLSPHKMAALVSEYEAAVSPIRNAVFSFISSLPEEERDAAYSPLLNAWPAGIGWTTPTGLKDWATELYTPVDCEKPTPEETNPINEGIIKDADELGNPVGYSEKYTAGEFNLEVTGNASVEVAGTVDGENVTGTGTGTITGTAVEIPTEYTPPGGGEPESLTELGKVTGKFDEALTTMDDNFGIAGANFDATSYSLERAFSGFKMHDKVYQEKLLYEGLPFAQAVMNYCEYVLCAGDPGRFSSVVDKVTSYVSTTGDVLDVLEKAKEMKFEDFGPGVANYSDVANMGMDKLAGEFAKMMGKPLPTPPSSPESNAVAVGTTVAAQGGAAGEPSSENFGTALGIWEAINKADPNGIEGPVLIAETFLKYIGGQFSYYIKSGEDPRPEVLKFTVRVPMTSSDVADFLDQLDAKSNSIEQTDPLNSARIANYVALQRTKSFSSIADTFFNRAKVELLAWNSNGVEPSEPSDGYDTYKEFVTEANMERTINLLQKEEAAKIFEKIGSKVDVYKLEKNTDVLDLSKVAKAVPPPMSSTTIPTSVSSTLPSSFSVPVGKLSIPNNPLTTAAAAAQTAIEGAVENVTTLATRALNIASSIKSGISGIVTNLPSSAKSFADKISNVRGFPEVGNISKVASMLKNVETNLPTPDPTTVGTQFVKPLTATALNSIKEVMPADVISEFKSAITAVAPGIGPILGSGAGNRYKVTDFLGSPAGMNGQEELWRKLIDSVSNTGVMIPGEGATLQAFTDALTEAGDTESGRAATEAYDAIIAQFKKEWALLNKAKVDFVNLPCGDIVSSINLSKKLAQYAHKLENGVAEIFNNVADPTSVGGQALLSVMVEARNTKLMHKAGFSPINNIESKGDAPAVSDEDRAEAAKIQAESGDPEAITPEQIARNRAINKTLTNALPKLPF